ncbi:major facilitator superfamily domain-containing protein [Aspergillus falconensis]
MSAMSVDEEFKANRALEVEIELEPASTNTSADQEKPCLKGWRLKILTTGLAIAAFLSSLDAIIVSTSLATIAEDLQAFEKSSWVVSSYLTTYFSFLIIWAKISDLVGRKVMLITALVVFLGFSGGCGGAQTALQLIVLRAFQGIGGAGIFSMVPIITAEMVHPDDYAVYNAIMAFSIAMSFLLGPLIGGAIVDHTSWRWIFYINLPAGAVGILLIWLSMPGAFPDVSTPTSLWSLPKDMGFRGRVDYPGFGLLLAASVFLIVAIEEAAVLYTWGDAVVIVLLALSVVLLGAFLTWIWVLHRSESSREPVFLWEFVKNRVFMGMCLMALLSGVPLTTLVLELPGRFQILNDTSALVSGIRILPFTLTIAVSSALAGGLTARGRVPPFIVFSIAAVLQIVGLGLLYSVPADSPLSAGLYGYQSLIGTGVGMSLATAILTVPSLIGDKGMSAALGSITQLRVLGSAVGLSVATNLLNNTVQDRLRNQIGPDVLHNIMKNVSSMAMLPEPTQMLVRAAFASGYQRQLLMVLGFCAAEILALGIMWERPMRRLV